MRRAATAGLADEVRGRTGSDAVRRMAIVIVILCALGAWCASASADSTATSIPTPSTSILVNGDFSQPYLPDGNIPGWTATNGCGIEVWGHGTFVTEPFGAQALELASNCVSGVQQTVTDTPGQQYLVTYYFAARPGTSQSQNAIQASWNGTAEQSESTTDTTPTPYSFTVTGTGSDTLTFADTDPVASDSVGTVLALVSMQPVAPGPQLQWPAADATGASGSTLTATGKFDDTSGDPLTLSANNTVGTFTDNGDGSWSWTYTPSQANAATPITVTASDGKGNTATDTFDYTTIAQGIATPCLPSGPWTGSATLQLVGMPPGDVEEAQVFDSSGNFIDEFDDWNFWYSGSGVDANGNETLTADGYTGGENLQPGTSLSVNVYSIAYGWVNATYSVPVCGLVVPSSPVTATTANPNGAPVSFSVSDVDAIDGTTDPVSCSDPAGPVNSGDTFPVGSTTVTCTSTDSTGTTTSASFVVQVTGPPALITLHSDSSVERGAPVTFTGQVTDSAGDPVAAGETVRLTGGGIDPAQAAATTDGSSNFSVQATPMTTGTDTITAFADTAGSGEQSPGDPSATTQLTVIAPPASTYTSCAQVQAQSPLAGDGTYFIDFGNGVPVPVYCAGMVGSNPQPYLTLQNTGPGANFSQNLISGVNTSFTRVHLVASGATVGGQTCTSAVCIDTSDTTFSTSTGSGQPVHYAAANTCWWEQATANVDLTGTPFAIAPNVDFPAEGWGPWGGGQLSANDQVVNLTIGGDCGSINATTDPILPLVFTQTTQTIAFPPTGVTYGQADFSPAAASSGQPVGYSNASGACTIDSQGLVQITGAGKCTVTADQAGDAAYTAASPVTQTFPVAPATLTVDAQDATTPYGAAPSLSSQLNGFVDGDTASSAAISGSASCAVASATPVDAGTYQSAIDCGPGTLSSPNGDYTFAAGRAGTLTITPATQSISLSSSPVTYGHGDLNPASATSGLPVSLSNASGACTTDAQGDLQITGAGTCDFTAEQGGDNDYQDTGAVTESLTVLPATLTVDAQDAATTYGMAPSLSSQLNGFVNGDTASSAGITGAASCTVASGTSSNAGTYPGAVGCSVGTLTSPNGDYKFTAGRTGTLTIGKATLTVDANPASTVYGQTPSLSATPHGFVDGDTAASAGITGTAACTVASGTGTDAGTYAGAVSCAPGTLTSANYGFVGGAAAALTITPAPQTITFTSNPPATPLVGDTYTVAATGGGSDKPVVLSVDAASTSGACTVTGSVVSFSGPGTCTVDANQAGTTDYTAAPQSQQTFVIQQPTTTTVTSSANPSVSGQSITLTATVAGQPSTGHVPTGTVTFKDGTTTLGTGALNSSGTATLTTSALSVASHAITAAYGGDKLDQASTSGTLNQVVNTNSPSGVAAETTAFLESSAKFQALSPAQQKAVSTILNGVSSALASFAPTLTPTQLKAVVAAYDAAAAVLESQGYLTAAQVAILDGAAANLP